MNTVVVAQLNLKLPQTRAEWQRVQCTVVLILIIIVPSLSLSWWLVVIIVGSWKQAVAHFLQLLTIFLLIAHNQTTNH